MCAHAEDTVPSCRSKKNVLVAMVRKGQGTDLLKHGTAVAANRVLIIRRIPATLFEKKFGSLKVVSFASLKGIVSWRYFLDISFIARLFMEKKRVVGISRIIATRWQSLNEILSNLLSTQ